MSPLVGDVVICPVCKQRSLDHTSEEMHHCHLAIPGTIEKLLARRALVCEGTDDMHDATLMASNGGVYCEAHQPIHTAVVAPRGAGLLYVIYDRPLDFPDGYVIRRHRRENGTTVPTGEVYTAESIDDIRHEMARCGLIRLPRHPDDDPVILEVWL
jgi:uncharacterized protein YbaR (Trm112 family)